MHLPVDDHRAGEHSQGDDKLHHRQHFTQTDAFTPYSQALQHFYRLETGQYKGRPGARQDGRQRK